MATTPTNPAVFSPALLRQPIADRQTLLVTQPWARWMYASWGRQGGAQAPSNAELDSGLSSTNDSLGQTQDSLGQTQDSLGQTQDDLSQTQTTVAGLEAELTALQEAYLETVAALDALTVRVTTLEGTVSSQGTRITALEAWKTAVVAALPALVVVVAVPALGNDPATAILLENDLSANWRPPINTNDTALQTAVNAVRNALAA